MGDVERCPLCAGKGMRPACLYAQIIEEWTASNVQLSVVCYFCGGKGYIPFFEEWRKKCLVNKNLGM